jgi:catalase
VLNRWPDNFFAETEQVAFCPSHVVPGIDFSNDPLLQGRLFSYLDTQLSRLGSANFNQIPVNAPKCPFANQQRDGHMQMAQPTGRVSYEPNTLAADSPREQAKTGFRSAAAEEDGVKGRIRAESFADHYSQARQFYISLSSFEQAHLASALVFELSKLEHPHIRAAMVGHLRPIEESLAQRVATGLGMHDLPTAPATAVAVQQLPASPALQVIGNMKDTLEGRVIGLLLADGSDAAHIEAVQNAVIRAGAAVKLVALTIGQVSLEDGSVLDIDGQLAGTPSVMFDAVVIILSDQAAAKLAKEAAAVDFIRDAFGHLKAIGFDRGGEALLKAAGIGSDEGVMAIEDNVDSFVTAAKTRQWGRETSVRTLA